MFQAWDETYGTFVAMKRAPMVDIDGDSRAEFSTEIELLQKLDHPHIVKYIDSVQTGDFHYIALEYMENGSL